MKLQLNHELSIQKAPPLRRSLRVLVAEDNAVSQAVARLMLQRLGCTVSIANNGREAVMAVREQEFDLIVMDCEMPEVDGFEATRAIRLWESEAQGPRTPIVALTANVLSGAREECARAGMNDYLSKPLIFAALADCLDRWDPETPRD